MMSQPVSKDAARAAFEATERVLNEMITHQRAKVLKLAREAVPYISPEDMLNPNDYPELKAHPRFDYEDGILAGLLSAQMAIRAELRPAFLPKEKEEAQRGAK
jgi:hypothetical protein